MSQQRPSRLYLVTRSDLNAGQKVVQCGHALHSFCVELPGLEQAWRVGGGHLVALESPSRLTLESLRDRLRWYDIPHAAFQEPDYGDELTAIAIDCSGSKHVRGLPLIGR